MTKPPRVRFAHDAAFWRRLARAGAARGPEWWVRYSPPVFGWAAALAIPTARRAVLANLRRVRGEAGPVRDAIDVARTFGTYAGCLAEVLSNGSKNEKTPVARIAGLEHLRDALAKTPGGLVLVTAHTAGWETVGPLLTRHLGPNVVMVMAPEPDERARRVQDAAREASGLRVAHVGTDPLASLPLLRDLRRGAIVGLQVDRVPPGMRSRAVTLLGARGAIPEGPLRLAAVSGAPILPLFCAREGYRRYVIEVRPWVSVPKRPTGDEMNAVAQRIADELGRFLRTHPTQWFHFGGDDSARSP